jgi:hypothetical protein
MLVSVPDDKQSGCAMRCEHSHRRPAELAELGVKERCAGQVLSSLVWTTLKREHQRRRLAGTNLVFQMTQRPRQQLRGLITEWVKGHGELLRTPGQRSGQPPGVVVGSVGGQISRVQEVAWSDLSHKWTLARLHSRHVVTVRQTSARDSPAQTLGPSVEDRVADRRLTYLGFHRRPGFTRAARRGRRNCRRARTTRRALRAVSRRLKKRPTPLCRTRGRVRVPRQDSSGYWHSSQMPLVGGAMGWLGQIATGGSGIVGQGPLCWNVDSPCHSEWPPPASAGEPAARVRDVRRRIQRKLGSSRREPLAGFIRRSSGYTPTRRPPPFIRRP